MKRKRLLALLEHDYGILTNDGFKWRSGDPGYGNNDGEYYACDPQLVDLAYEASVQVVGKEHTHKGTVDMLYLLIISQIRNKC